MDVPQPIVAILCFVIIVGAGIAFGYLQKNRPRF